MPTCQAYEQHGVWFYQCTLPADHNDGRRYELLSRDPNGPMTYDPGDLNDLHDQEVDLADAVTNAYEYVTELITKGLGR